MLIANNANVGLDFLDMCGKGQSGPSEDQRSDGGQQRVVFMFKQCVGHVHYTLRFIQSCKAVTKNRHGLGHALDVIEGPVDTRELRSGDSVGFTMSMRGDSDGDVSRGNVNGSTKQVGSVSLLLACAIRVERLCTVPTGGQRGRESIVKSSSVNKKTRGGHVWGRRLVGVCRFASCKT